MLRSLVGSEMCIRDSLYIYVLRNISFLSLIVEKKPLLARKKRIVTLSDHNFLVTVIAVNFEAKGRIRQRVRQSSIHAQKFRFRKQVGCLLHAVRTWIGTSKKEGGSNCSRYTAYSSFLIQPCMHACGMCLNLAAICLPFKFSQSSEDDDSSLGRFCCCHPTAQPK